MLSWEIKYPALGSPALLFVLAHCILLHVSSLTSALATLIWPLRKQEAKPVPPVNCLPGLFFSPSMGVVTNTHMFFQCGSSD